MIPAKVIIESLTRCLSECYHWIPQNMYKNVKAHPQEMLDIRAAQKSYSPWASAVVLMQWFSSLDLKCGYWQVKMDEESKPLATFTVKPLGFYKYKSMPFRLPSALITFQQLMETCLGNVNLKWCIIYMGDIVIFWKDPASHLERLEAVFFEVGTCRTQAKTI